MFLSSTIAVSFALMTASPIPQQAGESAWQQPLEKMPASLASPDKENPPSPKDKLRGQIDSAVRRVAQTFVTLPMGTRRIVEVKGKSYLFRLEPHYHPPGFEGGPNGWHRGVTVYNYVQLEAPAPSATPAPVSDTGNQLATASQPHGSKMPLQAASAASRTVHAAALGQALLRVVLEQGSPQRNHSAPVLSTGQAAPSTRKRNLNAADSKEQPDDTTEPPRYSLV